MTEHKLKGMGCEFDDLISDKAKVSETTVNGMSERQAASREMPEHYRTEKNGMTVSPACVSDVCMWFSKHYHTIRAALQTPRSLSDECIHECRVMIKEKTGLEAAFFDDLIALLIEKANAPRVPVIPGLEERLEQYNNSACYYPDAILDAACAYAALMKGEAK